MNRRFPLVPVLLLLAWVCAVLGVFGAPGDHLNNNASFIDYQGGFPVRVVRASNWFQMTEHEFVGTNFYMTVYRAKTNGEIHNLSNQVELFAQAPVCHYDNVNKDAWDAGHIILFTPTTNVFVQGDGFFFTQSNEFLSISNRVETRILKSVLKTPLLSGGASNASPAAPQIMKIFSDAGQFDYQSNRVDFENHVHLIDPQMDVTSVLLTVHFNTNGALESALAQRDVVMTTTNKGQATGERGFYYVTNASEMMELTGDGTWQNGDEEAQADYFLYDSNLHFLVGSNPVRVRWPNPAPGTNHPAPGAPPVAGTNGFRRLSADFATLQMPATNGPVETMTALGNVIITNEADHSRSTSEHAVYSRAGDSFELTGNPVWYNDKMEVKGQLLRAELTNQIYHARHEAQFKLNLTPATDTNAAPSPARSTNRWLVITSDDLDYRTNLATFHDHVIGRLLENDSLRDTLECDLLVITLESNHVVQAVASGHVHGRSEADTAGIIKTISCATLTAHCWPATNLLKDLLAETNVVLADFGAGAKSATNQLTATTVTAQFSAVTNHLESAVAESNVVLDQWKAAQFMHATGERAVYTAANDHATITGTPCARTQSYIITDSDFLVLEPKTNRFQAFGHYTITPVKPKTNQPPS
jgi:lipopolysaccharide export system protein LptA